MGFNNLRIVLIIKGCYKVKSIRPKSFFFLGRILIIQKSKYPEILHLLRFQNVEIHSCFHFGYLDIVNFDAYQKEQLTSFSAFLFLNTQNMSQTMCPKILQSSLFWISVNTYRKVASKDFLFLNIRSKTVAALQKYPQSVVHSYSLCGIPKEIKDTCVFIIVG